MRISDWSSDVCSSDLVQIVIFGFLIPLLTLISGVVILVAILAALMIVDPLVSMAAFVGFAAIYGVIIMFTRKRLVASSLRIAREQSQVIKVLQEGLGDRKSTRLNSSH